jgi:hypothetical protein
MTDEQIALLGDVASRVSDMDACQRGRIAERFMIVAWLRQEWQGSDSWGEWFADAIEAGEHFK